MGCCDSCGQVILVIINLLFSVIGIVLLAVACVVRYGGDLLDEYLQDAYNAFEKALREADIADDVTISNLNIGDLLSDATIAFIVIGAFFFVIGIVGCIGGCSKSRCLLIVYIIVMGVIFLGEVIVVVLLFTIQDEVDDWVRKPLVNKLEDDYKGTNATDAFSLAMNFVMHEFDCCGINNYTEFASATSWVNSRDNVTLVVPFICCKNTTDIECARAPTHNNSNIDQACYPVLRDWVTDRTPVLAGVGAGVAAVQVILIFFAIVVCCASRRDDDDSGFDNDTIPIQPYNESAEAKGHRNMYYQESPPTHRSDYQYDRQPSAPYQDYPGSEAPPPRGAAPYQGRTDYYTGPPQGYRSGDGYRR